MITWVGKPQHSSLRENRITLQVKLETGTKPESSYRKHYFYPCRLPQGTDRIRTSGEEAKVLSAHPPFTKEKLFFVFKYSVPIFLTHTSTLLGNHPRTAVACLFFSHGDTSFCRHEKDHIFLSHPPHLDQSISIIHKIAQKPSFIILVL